MPGLWATRVQNNLTKSQRQRTLKLPVPRAPKNKMAEISRLPVKIPFDILADIARVTRVSIIPNTYNANNKPNEYNVKWQKTAYGYTWPCLKDILHNGLSKHTCLTRNRFIQIDTNAMHKSTIALIMKWLNSVQPSYFRWSTPMLDAHIPALTFVWL
jgi:hypothetical protein